MNRQLKKKRILEFKNESISEYLEKLTPDKPTEYSLWKATKKIRRPRTQDSPLKMPDGKEHGPVVRNKKRLFLLNI